MTEQIKKACAKASALRRLLQFTPQYPIVGLSLRGVGQGFPLATTNGALATFLIGK